MKDTEKKSNFDATYTPITAVIWIILCLLNIFTYSRTTSLVLNIVAIIFWTIVAIIWIVRLIKSIKHSKDKRN